MDWPDSVSPGHDFVQDTEKLSHLTQLTTAHQIVQACTDWLVKRSRVVSPGLSTD